MNEARLPHKGLSDLGPVIACGAIMAWALYAGFWLFAVLVMEVPPTFLLSAKAWLGVVICGVLGALAGAAAGVLFGSAVERHAQQRSVVALILIAAISLQGVASAATYRVDRIRVSTKQMLDSMKEYHSDEIAKHEAERAMADRKISDLEKVSDRSQAQEAELKAARKNLANAQEEINNNKASLAEVEKALENSKQSAAQVQAAFDKEKSAREAAEQQARDNETPG